MVQKTRKEDQLNFLNIDWEKVEKEAQATHDKYNAPKEQQNLRVSQRSSKNVYSQSLLDSIPFLDGNTVQKPAPKNTQDEIVDNQTNKLNNNFDPENRSQRLGSVSSMHMMDGENVNPNKYVKGESSPSIFNADRIEEVLAQKDSRTRIREERETIAAQKKAAKDQEYEERMKEMDSVDTRKTSFISSNDDQVVHEDTARFSNNRNSMSIFDQFSNEGDFPRLASMSDGERARNNKQKEREESQKDKYISSYKSVNSSSIVDNMLDNWINSTNKAKK